LQRGGHDNRSGRKPGAAWLGESFAAAFPALFSILLLPVLLPRKPLRPQKMVQELGYIASADQ